MKKFTILTLTILVIVFIAISIFAGCTGNSARITINSIPEGATIYIDGTSEGKAPLTLTLAYGEHTLKAEKAGYKDKEMKIDIKKPGQTITITLSEIKNAFNIDLNFKSYPYPFIVYLDGEFTKQTTPCTLKGIPKGMHTVKLVSIQGTEEKTFNLKRDEKFTLRDFRMAEPPGSYKVNVEDYSGKYFPQQKWIVFNDDKPLIDVCCSGAATAYSNIFVNETVNISGYIKKEAPFASFDIIFPSGKKVHIVSKEQNGKKIFSKLITFDELGQYKISANHYETHFNVLYIATPLKPAKTVEELFGFTNNQISSAVIIPENSEQTIKLFITDANGKPIIDKPIGKYNAKTDDRGIVTLHVKGKCGFSGVTVNGEQAGIRLYGYLLCWVYRSTTINIKDTDAKYINGDIYIPRTQVLGYFFDYDIKDTKEINGKVYANLDTLKSGTGSSVIITNDKITFIKMRDMVP
jgi:hypothetical protein